jgi:hypothetical protein
MFVRLLPFDRQAAVGDPEKMPRCEQGGQQDAVDEKLAVGLVGGQPVQLADEQGRAADLLIREGIGAVGKLPALDRRPHHVVREAGAGRADRLLDVVAEVGVLDPGLEQQQADPPADAHRRLQPAEQLEQVAAQGAGVDRRRGSGGAGRRPDRGDDHLLLVRPASIERRLRGVGAAGDLLEGEGVEAALRHQLHDRGEDRRFALAVPGATGGSLGLVSKRHGPYRN